MDCLLSLSLECAGSFRVNRGVVMPLALIEYPRIDPMMFQIGGIGMSWYAFNYLLTLVVGYFVLKYCYRKGRLQLRHPDDVGLLATYFFYGMILGARLFYVLFYNLSFYLSHPWEIPAIWHGGMSFHGGLVGAALGVAWFSRRYGASFFQITDILFMVMPLGLGLGRITNFINGELWGRVGNVPWAMVFPGAGPDPRHPSQLYEAILEGPVLFAILWGVRRWRPREGIVSATAIIAYGIMRFFVEFFREPDAQLGFLWGVVSMGQLLSLLMVLFGVFIARISAKKNPDLH